MSAIMRQRIADYLAVRRSLGFTLERPQKLLAQFADHLDEAGAASVTLEHALAWATQPGTSAEWHAYRLTVVRGFASWLRTIDASAEVPPPGLIPARPQRATPYLYTDAQIAAVMAACSKLRFPLRQATYRSLIGLLSATGMRIGEAIGLDRQDADLDAGVIRVRYGKNGKSRLVPLQHSAADALAGYLNRRDRDGAAAPVFISPAGTRLLYCNVHATWSTLATAAGLRPRSHACRPRIHDLRHTFAVRTLLDAYRTGGNADTVLATLSTYLGHADPAATYWYLTASPELMAEAARRLETAEAQP